MVSPDGTKFEMVPLNPQLMTTEMLAAAKQANKAGCQIWLVRQVKKDN